MRGATCCGQPAWNSGFAADARRVARRTLAALDGLDAVVVPSGSCAAMMRLHWPELFRGDRDEARAERVSGRVFELSQYLVDEIGWAPAGAPRERAQVGYHDSCHMLRELRCATSRARSSRRSPTCASCPAPTAAAASAGRSRSATPRSRRRWPTTSWRRRPPPASASSRAPTRAASCRSRAAPHARSAGRPGRPPGDGPGRGARMSGFEQRAAAGAGRPAPAGERRPASPSAPPIIAPRRSARSTVRGCVRRRSGSGRAPSPSCRPCSTGCRSGWRQTGLSCTGRRRGRTRPGTSPRSPSGTAAWS